MKFRVRSRVSSANSRAQVSRVTYFVVVQKGVSQSGPCRHWKCSHTATPRTSAGLVLIAVSTRAGSVMATLTIASPRTEYRLNAGAMVNALRFALIKSEPMNYVISAGKSIHASLSRGDLRQLTRTSRPDEQGPVYLSTQ